jgi:hypothetical protein
MAATACEDYCQGAAPKRFRDKPFTGLLQSSRRPLNSRWALSHGQLKPFYPPHQRRNLINPAAC